MTKVLVLGGYGNFGKRICEALANAEIPVIVSGRNELKAHALANELGAYATAHAFDVRTTLDATLKSLRPHLVINLCGPFQTADYAIAECCIENGIDVIDLADAREYVTNITTLDKKAKEAGVRVISGASTLPALSAAVIDHYKDEFSKIEFLKFGIAPGQKAERGLATTQAIMTYVGKPIKPFPGIREHVYGWQDLYKQSFPEIGNRWMANCDVPELDLFPKRYDIERIQFSAGIELPVLHWGLWACSWLVRAGIPIPLVKLAPTLLRISNWFNAMGSEDGGMHIIIKGKDKKGKPHTRKWFIIGFEESGPHIPTAPAIALAKKFHAGELFAQGAYPCVGLVTLDECLQELALKPIKTFVY